MIFDTLHWNFSWPLLALLVHYLLVLYLVSHVLLRPDREPASRVAWIILILAVPVLGMVIYLFLGETNIGSTRAAHMRTARENLIDQFKSTHPPHVQSTDILQQIPRRYSQVFAIGHSVNGFLPVPHNHGKLMRDSETMIDSLVHDIEGAQVHVHLFFYIWLPDESGAKIAHALMRAAQRGVTCRVMVDAVGSRDFVRSDYWEAMRNAGVRVAQALTIGNPIKRVLLGRIDLRNHRKIMVIDHRITYCGSQNCADAAFLPKAKFAPWVDIMVRLTGPIVWQNQIIFLNDWEATTGEKINLSQEIPDTPRLADDGFIAQVIATGPTERYSAMSDTFLKLISSARYELNITTPYFIPNESILSALCIAARCGTQVTLNVPKRNDSWIVAAASRSYYRALLLAGVRIYEYEGGLLHSKLLTIDQELCLIGSANLDRRSFDLNYENNMVLYDAPLTQAIIQRQQSYLNASQEILLTQVNAWPKVKLLWFNTVAILGPLL